MREVGVLEAKTNLSSLIAGVMETGEPITITRHGKPAVRLVSAVSPRRTPEAIAQAVARLRGFREEAERGGPPGIDIDQFMREVRGED